MRLLILTFGKLKTPGIAEAAYYYHQLIRPWVDLELIELKPLPVIEKSPATRQVLQKKEGQMLMETWEKKTKGKGALLLLDEKGKALTTQLWAQELKKWGVSGNLTYTLVIGSSLGFSQEVRQCASGLFSLGPQTVSHELARVILLEQLYRAESVNRGHPYHNEGS